MSKLISFIGRRLKPFLERRNDNRIRQNFRCHNKRIENLINEDVRYNVLNTKAFFTYKDNTWNYIENIWYLMWNDLFTNKIFRFKNPIFSIDNICKNTKVQYLENKIRCYSHGEINDWIFLKFNRSLKKPYVLSFETKLETENSEFQVAFNYNNIGKRYRFNLKNNRVLSFDVVGDGCFVNNICVADLSLKFGVYYNIKIVVTDSVFQYLVNDQIILSVKEETPVFNGESFVFILWDSNGREVDVCYKNIKIYSL